MSCYLSCIHLENGIVNQNQPATATTIRNNELGTKITVPKYENINGTVWYDIQISIGPVNWMVKRRFKEFVELNDKLVTGHSMSRDLLPPKKMLGNLSPTFLDQRRRDVEKYLENVLIFLRFTMPPEFIEFLHFQRYDIIFLLHELAQQLYEQGDMLLAVNKRSYTFSILELYAIAERLKIPCPGRLLYVSKMKDFSHVLDFCSQLECLTIKPNMTNLEADGDCSIGTSNIVPNKLKFDLNAFRNLKSVRMLKVSTENLADAALLRDTIVRWNIHQTDITHLNQIFLCDSIHKTDNLLDDATLHWSKLLEINFSSNRIRTIDSSIKLCPQLQTLTLDNNHIQTISNLNCLPRLNAINLSRNRIGDLTNFHLELGNVTKLNLSQNQIRSLNGLSKLYSLVTLNVSSNFITDINEVDFVARLPCLEELMLTGNPVAGSVDYRARILSHFGDRCHEIYLDNEKGSAGELDMALVLAALRISETATGMLTGKNKNIPLNGGR